MSFTIGPGNVTGLLARYAVYIGRVQGKGRGLELTKKATKDCLDISPATILLGRRVSFGGLSPTSGAASRPPSRPSQRFRLACPESHLHSCDLIGKDEVERRRHDNCSSGLDGRVHWLCHRRMVGGSAKMSHTGAEAARGQAAVAKLGPRCPHADHRPPPLHP